MNLVIMISSIKIITLFALIFVSNAAEEDVLELSDSDFQSSLDSRDVALVMFYAPWCGHCKRLKPEFGQAAGTLKYDDPPVTLAKVDCTEAGKATCEKFSVSGYPTLKIFKNGAVLREYSGPREASGIVKYMRAQVGPSSKELLTVEDYEKMLNKDDVVVIGFFEKETDLKGEFLKAADKLREDVPFAHSSKKDVLEKAGYKNNIVLFRPKRLQSKFEESAVVYEGEPAKYSVEAFVKEHYHGLVGHRTRDNAKDFSEPIVIAYYEVDYVKNVKGTNYWRNRVLKVASDQLDLTFAISSKDDFGHELNDYGIDFVKGGKPAVAGKDKDGNKFVMKEEFSVESLLAFAKDLLAGKLETFIKSEPVPESNDGPVTIAVGKNFKEVVTDNGKDSFVEFYAPWCGHCQKLTPIWDELGEKLKDEGIAVIKMDATANDWPKSQFEVQGFPTIYWKPKDPSKKPVKYNGGRELQDFIKYAAEHATNELQGYDRKGNPQTKDEL